MALILWLLAATNVLADVSPSVMELQPEQSYTQLSSHIRYLEDPQGDFDFATIIARKDFNKLPKGRVSFGSTHSIIWLKLPLRNVTDQSGQWKLIFKVRFMEPIDVYWAGQAGGFKQILHSEASQPFAERDSPYRFLVSDLQIQEKQQGTLFVRYGSKSSTRLPVEILSESRFIEEESNNAIISVGFTGAIFMLILVNLFQYFALSRPAYLFYSLQELFIILYIGQMEGYNFMYLWPDFPLWNAKASVFLGFCLILFPSLFMRNFLGTQDKTPTLDKVLRVYMLIVVLLMIALPFTDSIFIKRSGFYLSIVMICLLLGSGVYYSFKLKEKPARYYLAGWLSVAVSGWIFSLEQLQFISDLPLSGINILKLGTLLEAIMLSAALADQVRRIKEERDQNQVQLVKILEQRLEEAQQMSRLEKDRSEALNLARHQSDQLNSASHDLRSPLYALRMAIKSQSADQTNPELVKYLEENMDYMQSLIADLLKDSEAGSQPETSLISLNGLLKRCVRRHEEAAKQKGVALHLLPSSIQVQASYFLLERILDNLLGNAVRYTSHGKVLIGIRRRTKFYELQVHDTGPGMTKAEIEEALKPFVKISNNQSNTPGYGLGLSITRTFCDQLGYELKVLSRPGKGSMFSICIPR